MSQLASTSLLDLLGGSADPAGDAAPSPPILARDALAEALRLVGFDAAREPSAFQQAEALAARIRGDGGLTRLLWHAHWRLFRAPDRSRGETREWPATLPPLDEHSGAFYLLAVLSGLEQCRAFHRERGVPEAIARATYSDTYIWAEDYHSVHGVWGVWPHIIPWLLNHLSGDLYRVVRLQFVQRPFRSPIHAFRHRETRALQLLSDAGVTYRSDGLLDGTGGEHDPAGAWTSRFELDDRRAIGTPIHRGGYALREEMTLSLAEWERVLTPGEPILEVHIPRGDKMDIRECGESFREGIDFFPRCFPDRPFRAYCCTSWMLNTQFQEWLPATSNMVGFQREFYLYPIRITGRRSGFDRIFGWTVHDVADAPRDTTLRRAAAAELERGGALRGGGGLLFAEDLRAGRAYPRQA